MLNILLTPIGSVGAVYPYLAIAEEMKRRGHHVSVLTDSAYERNVQELGIEFVRIGDHSGIDRIEKDPESEDRHKGWKKWYEYMVFPTLHELFDAIAARYKPGVTVTAGPGMAAAARAAHEKLGIPCATIHVNPWQIRSVYRSPTMPLPMMMYDWVPKISKRLQYGILDRFVLNPFADSPIDDFRREIGLPTCRGHLGAHYHSPQRIIGLFPDWWAEPQPDWPPQTVCTGFPLWDRGGVKPPPQEVMDFLEDGQPPVILFAGTVRQDARRLFDAGLEACRRLGRRAVLLTKHHDLLPSSLPPSAATFQYVPFGYLLPRSAAMVHHAGIGTTSQGLLAGIPHVAMPRGNGPPFTARLLKQHGVGQVLYPNGMNATALTRCLRRLLNDPATEQNCRRIADKLKDTEPVARACDELEALAGTDVPNHKIRAT